MGIKDKAPVPAKKKSGKTKAQPAAPSADLFVWIDALYNKKRPEGTPPMYMVHRFVASDQALAPIAAELQKEVREAPLMFWVWQGILGRGDGAPRFGYAAPKKSPPEEELVARMERVLGESRRNVESMVQLVRAAGREQELYYEFGVKVPTGATTK